MPAVRHPSSYRDPSGFIFEKEGILYRQVNQPYQPHYDHFIASGCYEHLVSKGLLLPHSTINDNLSGEPGCYLTLQPERIRFISYPYEWSFGMLKDAALLTLQLLREALGFGMILKDATPYNIQWHRGQLVFIDTLSFEKYEETKTWVAYRQFCESFLAPLLLMSHARQPLQELMLAYPDGIPLPVAKALLPFKSRFSLHTFLHIHLHARVSEQQKGKGRQAVNFSRQKLLNLIDSLETGIKRTKLPARQSTWSGYYEEAATRDIYLEEKQRIIGSWLAGMEGLSTVADLGANEGLFARLAAPGRYVLAADLDPYCVDALYHSVRQHKETGIQPMVIDLANPSPGNGVNNRERLSFMERCKADLVLALALIHHLAIGRNIPFPMLAGFFDKVADRLLIEFVPKEDEKAQLLLARKEDSHPWYTQELFERSFSAVFHIEKKDMVKGTKRILYLLKSKHLRQ